MKSTSNYFILIAILSSHLHLGLENCLFLQFFFYQRFVYFLSPVDLRV